MGEIVLISLLQKEMEWAIIQRKKMAESHQMPPFTWDGKDFHFEDNADNGLKFAGLHTKLNDNFDDRIKTCFIKKFATQLQTMQQQQKSKRIIIVVPTAWPEWLLQQLLTECRRLALQNISVLRSIFLAAISAVLNTQNKKKAAIGQALSLKSLCDYKNDLFFMKTTAEESVPFSSLAGLIQSYFNAKVALWEAKWPLSLGIQDPSGKWWNLIDEADALPLQCYFCFHVPQKSESAVLNILARSDNGFTLEVLSMELPENRRAKPMQYSLKLAFRYAWTGKAILRDENRLVQEQTIYMPFMSYL